MTAPALPALPEIQRLLAEATPGPWTISSLDKRVVCGPLDRDGDDVLVARVHSSDRSMVHTPSLYGVPGKGTGKANAALIAALRTAAPALIEAARERDEIRALAERLARALEGAAVAVPVLGDMQHIVGLHLGEEQARKIAAEIDAALSAARSAGLIEETEGRGR